MREILFKAKSIGTNEWFEGYYAELGIGDNKEYYIIQNCALAGLFKDPKDNMSFNDIRVDPETVCQYTGLKDTNDTKIFENDIVSMHQFLYDGDEYEKESTVLVKYTPDMACFSAELIKAKELKVYMGYSEDEKEVDTMIPLNDFYGLHEESFEVIGNVFDNPELLEVR